MIDPSFGGYKKDRILEIAVFKMGQSSCLSSSYLVTNGNGTLEVADGGLEFVIRTEKSVLDKFGIFPQVQNVVRTNMLRG